MNECKECGVELNNQRAHIGYTECLECSEVEHYSAHTVYPHKTGGFVQPVSKTTSNHLKSIDRRSVGNTRRAKGIVSDNSWDRWLEKYYDNLYNPKPKKTYVETPSTIVHKTFDDVYNKTILQYKDYGYTNTKSYINELYSSDTISMMTKSKLVDEINQLQMTPKKLRKWSLKIN